LLAGGCQAFEAAIGAGVLDLAGIVSLPSDPLSQWFRRISAWELVVVSLVLFFLVGFLLSFIRKGAGDTPVSTVNAVESEIPAKVLQRSRDVSLGVRFLRVLSGANPVTVGTAVGFLLAGALGGFVGNPVLPHGFAVGLPGGLILFAFTAHETIDELKDIHALRANAARAKPEGSQPPGPVQGPGSPPKR
jgi:hypothetical protein